MFKNVFYDKQESVMHLWYDDKYRSEYWTPYVFKPVEGDGVFVKTIDGQQCMKVTFDTYVDYENYQKDNPGMYENHVKPETQYLVEKYHDLDDDSIIPPPLVIYAIDIEVNVENNPGTFPTPEKAEEPITVISLYDFSRKKYIVFGLHPYQTDNPNVIYHCCKTEDVLLRKFFDFAYKHPPDVYTGWNICKNTKTKVYGFDFHYIINRTKKLFKEKLYLNLSPIKKVLAWESKDGMAIQIAGVSLLDYQSMYKWFSSKRPERFTLDFIVNLELGERKLEYEGNLTDLYKNDWRTYVDYNIKDTLLIEKLEEKLGYLNLVQGLSIITRCQMDNYYSMTQMLEGKLLLYYRKNNLCAPVFKGGTQESYLGGYVKSPNPTGLHDWIISLDITSSYPTAIISLNMSIETYLGKISSLTEDEIINSIVNKKFNDFTLTKNNKKININGKALEDFNKLVINKKISIAPCGTLFKNGKEGVISHVERDMFLKRKEIKNKMKKETDKNEIKKKHTFQWALKILLNSMYGITAVPYSRYFNTDIAEAIAACAKHSIKQGEKYTNDLLNSPEKYDKMTNILNELRME